MPRTFRTGIILLLTLVAASACAEMRYAFVPVGAPTPSKDRGVIATNTGETAARLTVDPVVFELGAGNRHWRRAYPVRSSNKLVLWARPGTSYEMWKTDSFVDHVLRSVCQADPSGMKQAQKLKVLATTLFNLRASKVTDESTYKARLVSEAYQALVGLRFDCIMHYTASGAADYRVFAGHPFDIECRVLNDEFANMGPCTVRIIAPDEWKVSGGAATFTPVPCRTKRCRFTITAPGRSMLRPKQYPVIADLTFRHQGRKIVAHYPITVEVSAPFTALLNIISADREHINAEITTKSLFEGVAMNNISAYPFIPDGIRVEPAMQSFSFKDTGRFRVRYVKTGDPSPALRSVNVRMRVDEHTVDLRTVMEAYLPLGRRTYGEALWMNDADDGKSVPATIEDRKCRQTASGSQYMYFALSRNFPISGNTYIAVTYFDALRGSLRIQYDAQTGAYKDSAKTVQLAGTNTWRQALFVLPDVRFENRQKASSDFRLAVTGCNVAIADVVVSKFALGDTPRP